MVIYPTHFQKLNGSLVFNLHLSEGHVYVVVIDTWLSSNHSFEALFFFFTKGPKANASFGYRFPAHHL